MMTIAHQRVLMLQDAEGAEKATLDGRHDGHVDKRIIT